MIPSRPAKIALLEQWKSDGILFLFGNPGSSEEALIEAIEADESLKYILCLHETVAVAAADGFARATQKPAVVQLHAGVGLGNGIGMIYQAFRGHSPLVVISGEAGVKYENMDSQMACSLVDLVKPVTKYATRVTDPNQLLRVMRRAYKIAATPPTGPVFVALPQDILDAPNSESVFRTEIPTTRFSPGDEDLEAVARELTQGKNPIILMGDGVAQSGAQNELTELAELLGADVYGVNSSEVNISCLHPRFAGLTGHMFGRDSKRVVEGRDVVLICGTYVFPEVFPETGDVFDADAKIIHIDLNAYEIGKNHRVDRAFVGDPKTTLGRLVAIVKRHGMIPWNETIMRSVPEPNGSSLMELFAAALRREAEKQEKRLIVFDEALTSSPALCNQIGPTTPGEFFQTRGGSLGVSLPGVLGTTLAFPEKISVAFSGDGGAMYVPQALWTAARYGINAKFVICSNHSYRLLEDNIKEYWKERDKTEQPVPDAFQLDRPNIDFVKLAESQGVRGMKVKNREQVDEAIQAMFASIFPFLIEIEL